MKVTGKTLNGRLGKIHFWMVFLGIHATFLIQHWLEVLGMPHRYADSMPQDNLTWMNQLSTAGSPVSGASINAWFWNVDITWHSGKNVKVDDPWGFGASPRIRSERPALDLHYPELALHNRDIPVKTTATASGISE